MHFLDVAICSKPISGCASNSDSCYTNNLLIVVSSHPDKVKISANDTIESIANKFVDITKAYKSCVHFIIFILT